MTNDISHVNGNEKNIEKAHELRKLLDIIEGKPIIITWNKNNNSEMYNINIERQNFSLSETNIFFLLKFFGFNSFYPNRDKENTAIIQIPKLWYKSQELKSLLKDIHIQTIFWSYKKDDNVMETVDSIMRKSYENMKTIYFSHPMITYNTDIEKECLNIIEKEIGNKLPSSIKEIINPNSEKYRWKKDHDMHETENWGFSWSKFANSMPHYCDLVYKSDGLIYLPIFDLNKRKNARIKFTRKTTRGVKTEISYCTKLGDPLITFIEPDNNMTSTNIELPYYTLEYINGKIINEVPHGEKIIDKFTNNIIGKIENNTIKNKNNKIIGKITKNGHIKCEKCNLIKNIQLNETLTESNINDFIKNPHKNCGGKMTFFKYGIENIINKENEIIGHTTINVDTDYPNFKSTKNIQWREFKHTPYPYYRDENDKRYKSSYPFHMYINKKTYEIHESPKEAGCSGGDFIPFEPWDGVI